MNSIEEIAMLTAVDVIRLIEDRVLDHKDVVIAHQERVVQMNPSVNAFDSFVEAPMVQRAGPLMGLPVTVKDQIGVEGLSRHFGLDTAVEARCESTSVPIGRLIDAGANIAGKTTLPPFAMDFQTYNARKGWTNNPWHLDYTVGGSSGGGAAAVACGMSYLDIGADLAGSLRIPASFCGVYSLLPSENALESDGMLKDGGSLAHFARMGPLARSVDDLMLAWEHLSGTTPNADEATVPQIGIWEPAQGERIADDITSAFTQATIRLKKHAFETGSADTAAILTPEAYACYGEIMGYETGALVPVLLRYIGRIFGRSAAKRSPNFLANVHSGQRCNKNAFHKALNSRSRIEKDFNVALGEHEAWLVPVTRTTAFKHIAPNSDRNGVRNYSHNFVFSNGEVNYLDAMTDFLTPFSLVGAPVVTLPVGFDRRGLPIGAQLIGRRGEDWALLKLAKRVASALAIGGFEGEPLNAADPQTGACAQHQ